VITTDLPAAPAELVEGDASRGSWRLGEARQIAGIGKVRNRNYDVVERSTGEDLT
jgi:hypothetical protein